MTDTPDPAAIAASLEWQHIDSAPKDRWIFVYAAPYFELEGFVCVCHWHPDAGFCVDELREAVAWMPITYPAPPPVRRRGQKLQTTVPGYWMNETSGVLRPAVEAYLNGQPMTSQQIGVMRAYLRQWMQGSWEPDKEVEKLRHAINVITTRETLSQWLEAALAIQIDPL